MTLNWTVITEGFLWFVFGFTLLEYVALYTYESPESGDLTFCAEDVVLVTEREGEWWRGCIGDQSGLFPSNYVKPKESEVCIFRYLYILCIHMNINDLFIYWHQMRMIYLIQKNYNFFVFDTLMIILILIILKLCSFEEKKMKRSCCFKWSIHRHSSYIYCDNDVLTVFVF